MENQLRILQLGFIEEANQILAEAEENLLELDSGGYDAEKVKKAFRLAHNFKGSARSVGFAELGRLAHRYEDILAAVKSGTQKLDKDVISALLHCNDTLRKELGGHQHSEDYHPDISAELTQLDQVFQIPAEVLSHSEHTAAFGFFDEPASNPGQETKSDQRRVPEPSLPAPNKNSPEDMIKIPASRLDALLNIIGELVVNQSIVDDCRSRGQMGLNQADLSIGYMSKLISDLQNLSLSLRLVPIKPLFQKLRRTARDLAESLNKNVRFVEEGDYCELDKSVIDRIADPLNHMIRNAVDHGIDSAADRMESGKPPEGTITLSAATHDDHVKIVISDDGRGLNKDKIIAKARASGLIEADAKLDEQEIFSLIFQPGFSTQEQVTDVSGRGVGMEVVQRAIEELKGSIRIESSLGKGTRFEITLPLSLSIIGGLVVEANSQRFVIPVSQLIETLELSKYSIETITGIGRTLNLRGEVLPIYSLPEILSRSRSKAKTSVAPEKVPRPALIARYKGKKVTFEVERIVAQQRVVLKHLGPEFDRLPGIVAGAILSNGEPGLVLSLDSLATGMDL